MGIVALVLLVALLGVVLYLGFEYVSISRNLTPENAETRRAVAEVLDQPPVPAKKQEDPTYILVLGADRRPGQGRARSDTILVVRLDPNAESASMLSIPRDTRVPIGGHGTTKINHANAYGGPALTIRTVKEYTGLPLHHYVEIDFAGFAEIVDAVGGVTVDVDRAIDDENGRNTGGVSAVTHIPAGRQRLNGAEALTFVRSRAYADGDFTRIRNQQKLLTALMKEATRPGNLARLPRIANATSNHVDTDMSVGELLQFAEVIRQAADGEIEGFTAPGRTGTIDGVSYVIPDEAASRALFESFAAGTAGE